MSLFQKIRGTIETAFQIGLGRALIRSLSTGELEVRNASDTGYANLRVAAPVGDNDAVTKKYADTLTKPVIVSAQFDGNNALPSNTGTRQFFVVSTTGATASIGDLIFDNGSGVGTAEVLTSVEGRTIAVTDALSGGTVSFDPDSLYLWDADGSAWVKIGDIGAVTGAVRVVRYAITNAATQDSSSTIPANARVMWSKLVIGTPYSGGATISIGRSGSTSLLQATTDNLPQSTAGDIFMVEGDIDWGGSALAVRTTVGGAPAAGAGFVLVAYTVPNALSLTLPLPVPAFL